MNRTTIVPALMAMAAGLLLAACSGGVTLDVPDFSIPAGTSLGQICWQEVGNPGAPTVTSARFDATATFEQSGIGTGEAEVRIYGRSSAPASTCTSASGDASTRTLSDPVKLTAGEPTSFAVGDGEYGTRLATVVSNSEFWIGAAIENFNLSTEPPRIEFTDGSITVVF